MIHHQPQMLLCTNVSPVEFGMTYSKAVSWSMHSSEGCIDSFSVVFLIAEWATTTYYVPKCQRCPDFQSRKCSLTALQDQAIVFMHLLSITTLNFE